MNDHTHPHQELAAGEAERLREDPSHQAKEKAFRLAVARRFYAHGQDTKQIADEMKVDEAAIYNVLDKIKRERINA